MRKHPSGRPIRRHTVTRLSIPRPPPDEPLTPGLRKPDGFVQAVGFHAGEIPYDLEEGDDEEDAGSGG